jgi:hypothetical protein
VIQLEAIAMDRTHRFKSAWENDGLNSALLHSSHYAANAVAADTEHADGVAT